MTDIYDQHKATFANVSAYVVLDNKTERAATVAFKFPRDGAGRLYAYVHWFGTPMARGFASGCGYDKRSAACSAAVARIEDGLGINREDAETIARYDAFRAALAKDDGYGWDRRLQDAGFTVLQAV